MTLRRFLNFYGGKWRLAPNYPRPIHGTIVEPFAGSAGYSTRYPDHDVILIERDPVIAEVWRYLIKSDAEEIRSLPLLSQGQLVSELSDLPDGARSLIGYWVSAGTPTPKHTPTPWALQGGGGFWGVKLRERLASQVDRISHWEIIEGDYSDAPDIEATWFVDPPYVEAGKCYKFGSQLIDFNKLAGWCRSRSGQVMVCENEGADWLPFRPFREQFGVTKRRAMEVMWTNDNTEMWNEQAKVKGTARV